MQRVSLDPFIGQFNSSCGICLQVSILTAIKAGDYISFEPYFSTFCVAHVSTAPIILEGDVANICSGRVVIFWVARQLVQPVEQLCLNSH